MLISYRLIYFMMSPRGELYNMDATCEKAGLGTINGIYF